MYGSAYNKSSVSQLTKSASLIINEDDMSNTELLKQVNYLKQQQKFLSLENKILEKTILRLEPSLMSGIQQALEYAIRIQNNLSANTGSFIRTQGSRFRLDSGQAEGYPSQSRLFISPSKISSRKGESLARPSGTFFSMGGAKINLTERTELVSTEMELIMKHLENYRKNATKQHALLRAKLEELKLREEYITNAAKQFRQTVVVEGWDRITQRIPAEIWVRFMHESMKVVDTQIGKLRLRTSTLNTQYSKLKGQIKMKASLSESLRPVDFEKLKIENKECLETIERKIQQLEELKKLTGDANLNLVVHKKAMMEQDDYLKRVLTSIKDKEKETVKLDKERKIIQVQVDDLDTKLQEVKKVRMIYEVPNVMDYVKVKAEISDLNHSIKILENRAHIQDIALASLNKKLKSIYSDLK